MEKRRIVSILGVLTIIVIFGYIIGFIAGLDAIDFNVYANAVGALISLEVMVFFLLIYLIYDSIQNIRDSSSNDFQNTRGFVIKPDFEKFLN